MKNVLFLLLVVFTSHLTAQTCLPTGIVLTTQSEVNEMPSLYPLCQIIEGDVTIDPNTQFSINNLDSLSFITSIEGDLKIHTSSMNDLEGLHNLSTIGGQLIITYNNKIDDLTGLNALTSVDSNVVITNNNELKNLVGLENLIRIGGDFIIDANNDFENLEAVNNLEYVGGDFSVYSDLLTEVNGVDNLRFIGGDFLASYKTTSFENFESLDTILGNLELENLYDLENYVGFDNLKYIGGHLDLDGSSLIDSFTTAEFPSLIEVGGDLLFSSDDFFTIDGFYNLERIGKGLIFGYLDKLKEISGFTSLTSIDSLLYIDRCNNLETIPEFNNLVHAGEIIIGEPENTSGDGNNELMSVTGFEQLLTVENHLFIGQNDHLEMIDGFNALTSVGGDLGLIRNGFSGTDSIRAFTSIEAVGGTFFLDQQNYNYHTEFNFLTHVGGDLLIDGWIAPSLALPALERVDGSFIITGGSDLINLWGLSNMNHIGGDFIIDDLFTFQYLDPLNALDSVGGDFIVRENNNLRGFSGCEQLSYIGGNLLIQNNEPFTDVDTSLTFIPNFSSLVHIGGSMSISSNEHLLSISGFNNLLEVDRITIIRNSVLEELVGFNNLKETGGAMWIGDIKFEIDGFDNLTTVGDYLTCEDGLGEFNLEFLSQLSTVNGGLSIRLHDNLKTLNGLQNLKQINGGLSIDRNYLLNDLSALSNLKSINGILFVTDNKSLKNLIGLQNIDPLSIVNNGTSTSLDDLRINDNDSLSICNIKSVCGALSLPDTEVTISLNTIGCNTSFELICESTLLSGEVFYDFNQNGIKDDIDIGLANRAIDFQPNDLVLYTDDSGRFYQFGETGSVYTLSYIDHPEWILTSDSLSYTRLFMPNQTENLTMDFGVFSTINEHRAEVSVTSARTRCNSDVVFYLKMENSGSFYESGNLTMKIDEKTTFVSAIPPPTTIDTANHLLIWSRDSIPPFQALESFKPLVTLGMPSELFVGDSIYFETTWNSANSNFTVTNNYESEIRCSYDPNDKLAMPVGVLDENYVLLTDTFDYTVRFQNTGNDYAIDVSIFDTISNELDISSFELTNSSHPVQVRRMGHAVEFLFEEIYLPDSISNEVESHGFVSYRIAPREDTPSNTVVENTAHIVFDFNPAIITNTTFHTLVDSIPMITTSLIETSNKVFPIRPNPTTGQFQITGLDQLRNKQIMVYNAYGQVVRSGTDALIDLSDQPSGMYWVKVIADDKISTQTILISR